MLAARLLSAFERTLVDPKSEDKASYPSVSFRSLSLAPPPRLEPLQLPLSSPLVAPPPAPSVVPSSSQRLLDDLSIVQHPPGPPPGPNHLSTLESSPVARSPSATALRPQPAGKNVQGRHSERALDDDDDDDDDQPDGDVVRSAARAVPTSSACRPSHELGPAHGVPRREDHPGRRRDGGHHDRGYARAAAVLARRRSGCREHIDVRVELAV